LQDIIRKNENKLTGILNGIDVTSYNPTTDKALFANFDSENLENKAVCKAEMQKMLGLPVKDVPVIAMISRLVSHKGIELVKTVAEDILHEDVQFVLLGTGDVAYEEYFKDLAHKYEGKVSANIAFNGDLSRKIYAGADIFLMPSVSEPCGLSQMIASRYATVPLVRETGGLYDSIKPYGNGGNGFTFASCNPYDMLYVIHEALDTYKNKSAWEVLMKKAATTDFSWLRSAEDYKALYQETLNV
jgi:starch synthase